MTIDYRIRQVDWCDAAAALSTIRRRVFINEQRVPEALEWDGLDEDPKTCLHLLAESRDREPIGTVRLLIADQSGHIGRMAVLPAWRGHGIGKALLDAVLSLANQQRLTNTWLDAQVQAIGFYQRAGFKISSDEFLDAGIPHRRMTLQNGPAPNAETPASNA